MKTTHTNTRVRPNLMPAYYHGRPNSVYADRFLAKPRAPRRTGAA